MAQTTEYIALEPTDAIAATQNSGIAPQNLTFLMTVVPVSIFAVIIGLTIHKIVMGKERRLQDAIMGFKVALLVGSIPIGLSLLATQTGLVTKADANPQPRNLQITTQPSNQIVISWRTPSKTIGGFRLSTNSDMTTILQTQTSDQPSLTHQFTLENLDPDNTYYLEVLSNNQWYHHQDTPILLNPPPN